MHYCDVIIGAVASQITSLTIVYSTVYSDADQRKQQRSAALAFVRGSHRGPVNSPNRWPVTRKNVSIWWRHNGLHTMHYSNNIRGFWLFCMWRHDRKYTEGWDVKDTLSINDQVCRRRLNANLHFDNFYWSICNDKSYNNWDITVDMGANQLVFLHYTNHKRGANEANDIFYHWCWWKQTPCSCKLNCQIFWKRAHWLSLYTPDIVFDLYFIVIHERTYAKIEEIE